MERFGTTMAMQSPHHVSHGFTQGSSKCEHCRALTLELASVWAVLRKSETQELSELAQLKDTIRAQNEQIGALRLEKEELERDRIKGADKIQELEDKVGAIQGQVESANRRSEEARRARDKQAPLVTALEDKNERLQHEMNQLYKVLHREAEGPGKVAIVESHLLKTKQKLTQARHEQSLDRNEVQKARRTISKLERTCERWKSVVMEQRFQEKKLREEIKELMHQNEVLSQYGRLSAPTVEEAYRDLNQVKGDLQTLDDVIKARATIGGGDLYRESRTDLLRETNFLGRTDLIGHHLPRIGGRKFTLGSTHSSKEFNASI